MKKFNKVSVQEIMETIKGEIIANGIDQSPIARRIMILCAINDIIADEQDQIFTSGSISEDLTNEEPAEYEYNIRWKDIKRKTTITINGCRSEATIVAKDTKDDITVGYTTSLTCEEISAFLANLFEVHQTMHLIRNFW